VFRTTDLALADWALAAAVASSVLLLDEARKLVLRLTGRSARRISVSETRRPVTSSKEGR